jgi:hypothetical protein
MHAAANPSQLGSSMLDHTRPPKQPHFKLGAPSLRLAHTSTRPRPPRRNRHQLRFRAERKALRHPRLKGPWVAGTLLGAGILALVGYEFSYVATGCNVKGNISNRGERIYHVPGQAYYSQTGVNWLKGERVFCSEEAPRQAGWRKAKA